ncbi:MAG TPA: type II toxin-antitoxin system prevent-host-death family antitoxin [Candidatus Acidoferrales bacterium]|jgi:prevent-host-death family protein|nr:type II toxin-antitoxin system prevent-host-death family antitoxin [Candidatus Acidoferrales bacterium]
MKSVGLRELKNRLSEFVREVRSGEPVLITDRGEVVAEIVPPGRPGTEYAVPSALAALARRGLLTLGSPNDPAAYVDLPPVLNHRRAAELLDEERRDR